MNPQTIVGLLGRAFQLGWNLAAALDIKAQLQQVVAYCNALAGMLFDFVSTVLWSGFKVNSMWNDVMHHASDQMREWTLKAFGDLNASINHIPGIIHLSVSTGTSRIYKGPLGQLRKQVHDLTVQVTSLRTNIFDYANRLNRRLKVIESQWGVWYPWLIHTGNPTVNVVRRWLKHPYVLANFIASPMTHDVVFYLGRKEHRKDVDTLLRTLAAHMDDTTTAIDAGIVGWLNSGSY